MNTPRKPDSKLNNINHIPVSYEGISNLLSCYVWKDTSENSRCSFARHKSYLWCQHQVNRRELSLFCWSVSYIITICLYFSNSAYLLLCLVAIVHNKWYLNTYFGKDKSSNMWQGIWWLTERLYSSWIKRWCLILLGQKVFKIYFKISFKWISILRKMIKTRKALRCQLVTCFSSLSFLFCCCCCEKKIWENTAKCIINFLLIL